jgi:putative DNA primase/helicase
MPKTTTDKPQPLTLTQYSEEKKLPLEYLAKTWGLKTVFRGDPAVHCVEQPYTRMDGTAAAPRYRYANEKKSPPNSGDQIVLYGQAQLIPNPEVYAFAAPDTRPCFLVEGESDTQTLQYVRVHVLGVPGTSMWDKCVENDPSILDYLGERTIFVIQEPPSAAEKAKRLDSPAKMVQRITKSLPNATVIAVKLWQFAPRDQHGEPLYKDASGLWLHYNGDVRKFTEALHIAVNAAGKEAGLSQQDLWELDTITADKIEPLAWEWLWEERVPLGCLTVFFGMGGTGKSTAAIDLAHRGSKGLPSPDKERSLPAFETLLFVCEDDVARTTVPRLMAAGDVGADLRLIHVERPQETIAGNAQQRRFAFDRDLAALERKLESLPNVRLVIVDPISSYLGAKNQNKNEDVRPLLLDLQALAERARVSVIAIMHFNKNMDQAAIHRISGASAWGEVPRALWAFVHAPKEDGQDPPKDQYLMLNAKLNIVSEAGRNGIKYETVGKEWTTNGQKIKTSWVRWHGTAGNTSLDDVLADTKKKPGPRPEKTEAAMKWLLSYLADGEKASKTLFADGLDAGHAKDTLYESKTRLGDRVKASQKRGAYYWRIAEVAEAAEGHEVAELPEVF